MNKFLIIFKREYLSRVKKKTFLLATFLTPIGFALLFVISTLLMTSGQENVNFGIIDESNLLRLNAGKSLKDNANVHFELLKISLEEARAKHKDLEINAILHIPAQNTENVRNLRIDYYSEEEIGMNTLEYVKSTIGQHMRDLKIQNAGLDQQFINNLKTDIELVPKSIKIENGDEDKGSSFRIYIATFLGMAMMMLIYMIVFIYGSMVMRSVMEEKTTRIVEVIVSSVKPFQLMLGKIIGVGAVGLTQFFIWMLFTPILYFIASLFLNITPDPNQMPVEGMDIEASKDLITTLTYELSTFNFLQILPLFLLFFVLGYLLYASLFAAVGSAMNDDWGEGQSLTLIISLPIIIGIYIGMASVQNPNGTLAVVASMIPLFSPIVMVSRLAFDPPMWQIIVAIIALVLNCLFFVWLAGRIYRVGILMFGKKPSIMQLVKWIFTKD